MKINLDPANNEPSKGYVSVSLAYHQCDLIREILEQQAITPIDEGKFHCTIAYDRDLSSTLEIDIDPGRVYTGEVIGVELLGDVKDGLQSAVALTFKSPELTEEHFRWMAVGFDHSWPEYIPHMSVAYDVPVEEAKRLVDILQIFVGQTFYFDDLSAEPVK